MELLAALVGGAMTRAFIVGFIVWAAMALLRHRGLAARAVVCRPLGAAFLSLLGVLTSICDKFDHAAAVQFRHTAGPAVVALSIRSIAGARSAFKAMPTCLLHHLAATASRHCRFARADRQRGGVRRGPALTCYWLLNKGWKIKSRS